MMYPGGIRQCRAGNPGLKELEEQTHFNWPGYGGNSMLVIARKKNESLVLGPDAHNLAQIEVVEIVGDKVRLGVVCRKEWEVHRFEVWQAIQQPEQKPPQAPES